VYRRVIFETGALEVPGALDAIREGMSWDGEVRVHTKLPLKMLAIDRSVALVPLAQHDTTPLGVLVYQSAVLDGLLALFEYVWDQAVTLPMLDGYAAPAADTTLSPEDRQLLSLLLAGLTDEAIAAHFRISARTVQRKVHALMEVANVRTRMQLAWEAARQGWLSEPADVPAAQAGHPGRLRPDLAPAGGPWQNGP
jgi:DNA-binding CsgD family transcriptional regulator